MQTHHMTGQANLHSSKIVDYTQCPHCHSRSISVYTGDDTEKVSPSVAVAAKSINTSASAESLLKRAFIFLEDEEWETADAYCEACLDKDPELAEAYLGKLMAELHVKTQTGLKDLARPFDDNANYKKTVRFGNDELKNTLCKYLELIHNRNEAARKDDILHQAKSKMTGNTISQYQEAIPLLASIAGWKDADEQKAVCYQKIEELGKKAEEKIKNARLAEIKQKQAAEEAVRKAAADKKRKKFLVVAAAIILVIISIFSVMQAKANKAKAEELRAKAEAFRAKGDHYGEFYYRDWHGDSVLGECLQVSDTRYRIYEFDWVYTRNSCFNEREGIYEIKVKQKGGEDVFYIVLEGREIEYNGNDYIEDGKLFERWKD